MNDCIYRTKDNECELYSEGGKYHAFCEMDGCEGRRMSNGDKLRAMADEELAKWIAWDTSCETCEVRKSTHGECECHRTDCGTAWLDWLKQEATDV